MQGRRRDQPARQCRRRWGAIGNRPRRLWSHGHSWGSHHRPRSPRSPQTPHSSRSGASRCRRRRPGRSPTRWRADGRSFRRPSGATIRTGASHSRRSLPACRLSRWGGAAGVVGVAGAAGAAGVASPLVGPTRQSPSCPPSSAPATTLEPQGSCQPRSRPRHRCHRSRRRRRRSTIRRRSRLSAWGAAADATARRRRRHSILPRRRSA